MTDRDFLTCLNKILNRATSYNNRYPYNVGYYDGKTLSFDCWNLVKAIDWSNGTIADNYRVGNYAIYTPAATLGDWNGKQILDHCSDVSGYMGEIDKGEFLLYEGDSHAGVYMGAGKVCECTVGWGQNGVILSDIDNAGRSFFRGVQRGRWYRHGKLPFVEYGDPYPIFEAGDKVKINAGAKVYGTDIYFASWVYEMELTVVEQNADRVVVNNGEYCIGAVDARDLTEVQEPFHPAEPKPPETSNDDSELDKDISWFKKYVVGLIKGLLEAIVEVFKGEKNA